MALHRSEPAASSRGRSKEGGGASGIVVTRTILPDQRPCSGFSGAARRDSWASAQDHCAALPEEGYCSRLSAHLMGGGAIAWRRGRDRFDEEILRRADAFLRPAVLRILSADAGAG